MGIFSSIWDKITVSPEERLAHVEKRRQKQSGGTSSPQSPQVTPSQIPQQTAPRAAVDVEAVLEEIAVEKGGGGNWRTSIVDLLKLLDLDSSLDARKELATELNVHAGGLGSAEQNIALSKAVWRELAKNGGIVPASLRD